jgi:heme exporter protein D
MESLSEFFAMGGYAAFVWPAYAVAAGIMTWLAWSSVRGLRADRRTLEKLQNERRESRDDETGRESDDA